jgi:hypothetical protein
MLPLLDSRFLIMQQLNYKNGRAVFSLWSMPRGYKRDEVWNFVESEFSMGVCEEDLSRRQRNSHCWSSYQETSSNRLRALDCALMNCKV